MKTSSILLDAALVVASIIGPVGAQVTPPEIVTRIAVGHQDLDLESETGARTMLDRLNKAATKACGGKPFWTPGNPVALAMQDEFGRCKAAALESSTLKLGSPSVRAAWLKKDAPSTIKTQKASRVTHEMLARLCDERSCSAKAGGRAGTWLDATSFGRVATGSTQP